MAGKTVSQRDFDARKGDLLIIDGDVYDISKFAMLHPGGEEMIRQYAGQDCTDVFYGLHRHEVIVKYAPRLMIGRIESAAPRTDANRIRTAADMSEVPYAEVQYFQGGLSPYWTPEHIEMRKNVRKWMDENLKEEAEAGELNGKHPTLDLYKKMGEVGLLAGRIGPGKHLKLIDRPDGKIFGMPIDKFDYFAESILHEEISRLACPGFVDGLGSGMTIGLPPVLQFGPDWMKKKVGTEVLSGQKRISLAITEAFAGSDVAGVQTEAVLSPDGSHYILNGSKKWITNGHFSDYFTVLTKTEGGMSMLLVERVEGVETKSIKTSYSPSAGTAYITFENVKVPKENLIGIEGLGFMHAMYNFNHERWMIISYILAGMRGMVDECVKWANQRTAFGKKLIQQPVIRAKIGKMISKVESTYAWFEGLTYQMNNLPYEQQSEKLAGQCALLKVQATRCAYEINDEAMGVFGGRAITTSGMGMKVERFNRTNKFAAILGGAEEVMIDLGVKQMIKQIPSTAKL